MDKKDYYYNPKEFRGRKTNPITNESNVIPFWTGAIIGFTCCATLALYVVSEKDLLEKAIDFTRIIKGWFA